MGGRRVEEGLSNLRYYCYEALYIYKSGVSGPENIESTADSRKMSNLPPAPTFLLIAFLIIQH